MENASKALVMAGSVIMAVVVLSLLVFAYNSFINVKRSEEGLSDTEKVLAFNKQYLAYERNVYGTELFSLANKMISYNEYGETEDNMTSEEKSNGFEKIHLSVELTENLKSKELNDVTYDKPYFKKGTYDEYKWIDNFNTLRQLVEMVSNFSYKGKVIKDSKTIETTKTIKELANMRNNELVAYGFTEDGMTTTDYTKMIKDLTAYSTYTSDLKKIKENPFKFIDPDNVDTKYKMYSEDTGRIRLMKYKR